MYEEEFGTAGGEPYGALIGDYEISNSPEDIEFLQNMAGIGAASLCPFITAASPALFDLDKWSDMNKVRDLSKGFQTAAYAKWRSFRDMEDSRYVSLVMPRVLARLPYGRNTLKIDEFDFEEAGFDTNGNPKSMDHDDYCWMNASYVMGTNLTRSFAETGFCTAIRGLENGGKVENLPVHTFVSDDGDVDMKCPTEIGITDRREKELSDLGFLPLLHYKNSDYAVFMGGQSVQRPKVFRTDVAKTEDYAISTRLPYIMAASRFGHYVKVMARDKIGSFMEVEDCERWLNNWIKTYVNSNKDTGPEIKARYPLRSAEVQVKPIPGKPGAYDAVLQMQPWLQMEELNASLQLVAEIPKKS
jgi:type VI secretion system protein ImpC